MRATQDGAELEQNSARSAHVSATHQDRVLPALLVRGPSEIYTPDLRSYEIRIRWTGWVLRVGVAGTFLGHGLYAVAVRSSWIGYLTTVGFSSEAARHVMPLIGMVDLSVALLVLICPVRGVFLWATCWALAAALIRPLSGESFLEFVERTALWVTPLAYLCLNGFPHRFRDLFRSETGVALGGGKEGDERTRNGPAR